MTSDTEGNRMRSGNGKHRRPRQAPALIVAAGVTGSAIAIPLLGATSAGAADASTWDRVAECESGGLWSADLGNGYYGGLQLSQDDWDAFGGQQYASRPDLASRSQQIRIAEAVLDARGPGSWSSCAAVSGLKDDGTKPEVDPGDVPPQQYTGRDAAASLPDRGLSASADDRVTSTDEGSSDASGGTAGADRGTGGAASGAARDHDSAKETGSPATHPSTRGADSSETPDPSATGGTKSADPLDSASNAEETGIGKHRGVAADEGSVSSGGAVDEHQSPLHASRDDSSARDAEHVKDTGNGAYTVRPGDNLWDIADRHQVPGGWHALYEDNHETVGSDPDLILPGQSLEMANGQQ